MDDFIRNLLTEYTYWFHDNGFDMDVPRPSAVVDRAVTRFTREYRIELKEPRQETKR